MACWRTLSCSASARLACAWRSARPAAECADLIVGDAMRAVVPGLVIGLAAAFFMTRFVTAMLYGIAPADPPTFLITPALILIVSLGASLWPASRAARVDPMIAMRAE